MARNLGRLFASAIELSTPKLGLSYMRTEAVTLSASNTAVRLIFSSAHHQQQQHEENPSKQEGELSEIKEKIQNEKDDDDHDGEDQGDGVDINEETVKCLSCAQNHGKSWVLLLKRSALSWSINASISRRL
ncbi:hypothetical protein F0562_030955 [Nyssa sinensis]|uniref:Uncharacterized protein n=1 Tax=Nyssa sinensis TaxID=561372 RepID=A0A5J5AXC9_9ASTE|nr:hypothetical protein F0562_030955 [Nyssa sinensis]